MLLSWGKGGWVYFGFCICKMKIVCYFILNWLLVGLKLKLMEESVILKYYICNLYDKFIFE